MRFRLTLRLNGRANVLPLNYQYELSSWIYAVLNKGDRRLAAWLHEHGYRSRDKEFKLFTFSHLRVPSFRVEGDRMLVQSGRVELLVSFYPVEVAEPFISGLFKGCSFFLGDKKSGVDFLVESVERCPEVEFTRHMAFRTLSPLFMDERKKRMGAPTRHLSPEEPSFGHSLHTNLLAKYQAIHGQLPPDDWEPTRFRLLGPPRSKVIAIKQSTAAATRLRAYFCRFELSGEPELLALAYHVGLGRLNSQGFGCIELLKN